MSLLVALAWLPPAGLGLLLAAALHREGGAWGWARALRAARIAALGTTALWLLARLFDWLAQGGGPPAWVGVSDVLGSDPGPFLSVVLRFGAGAGVLFAIATVVAARVARKPTPRPPLAAVAAGLALVAALFVVGAFAAGKNAPIPFSTALPLDLAAMAPLVGVAIAVGFLAPDAARVVPAPIAPVAARPVIPAVAAPVVVAGPDPEALLRGANLLGKGPPVFQLPAPAAAPAESDDPVDRIWVAAQGLGRAPEALRRALARVGTAGPGMLIGDLSAPTEAALTTALATAALLGRAARVLVVAADPRGVCDRVAAAQTVVGAWRPGLAAAADGELRDALARGTIPSLVALRLGDLSGLALAAATPAGVSWLSGLDLAILVRVDQLAPIEATHMAFTLRRLGLALDAQRARPAWVALGQGSVGSLRYLEQAALTPFEKVPLGPSVRAGVRVHVRAGGSPSAEIGAAERALAGVDAQVEDAVGELTDPTGRRTLHKPGYHGRASLALVDDRQLAGLYRARTGLAHQIAGGTGHVGIWWVPDSPLARFLLRDGALAGLEQQDELPSPRPVSGLGNRFLAAAHLEAALHEGRPDEKGLRRAFGDVAVTELLAARTDVRSAGRRARWDAEARQIDPSPILTAPGSAWPDPRRETVTASFVEVKNAVTGAVLRRVDRRAAPTRFYPHRVFRARGVLQQVAGEGLAAGAAELLVSPAAVGATPTDPELQVEITRAEWQARPEQHSLGKLKLARGVASIDVRERVGGAIPRGRAAAAVRFPAVTAEYPTVAAVVMFSDLPSREALRHAGRLAADLLPAHLLVEREDVEALVFPDGFGGVRRPALAFVDRHVGGIGVAEALDAKTLHDLLRWTWGVLYRCPCMNGCDGCTPPEVLAAGPDKVGALKLLGG